MPCDVLSCCTLRSVHSLDNAAACAGSHSGSRPIHAAEHGPDRTRPSSQQSLHAHSSQEGYGSEGQPGGQGEDVGRRQPGGAEEGLQGQHSNAAQLSTSQQPQEQPHDQPHEQPHEQPLEQPHEQPHQSLTGSRLVSRLRHAAMLWNDCSAEATL